MEIMKARKALKLAEKYKKELEEANFEIRDLKARLLESTEFKVYTHSVVRYASNTVLVTTSLTF